MRHLNDMKIRFLSILFLVLVNLMGFKYVNAQKNRTPQIELSLSVNRSQTYSNVSATYFDGHKGLIDIGIGVKYYFFASKRFNLIPALEYNQYRFYFEHINYSHYGSLYDVTYYLKRYTLPLALRYNWGKKIKAFAQAGVFGELVNDTQKETYPNQFPYFDENNHGEKVKTKVGTEPNYGYHIGLGVSFPISKFRLNLLLEYRHGLKSLNSDYEQFKLDIFRMSLGFVF